MFKKKKIYVITALIFLVIGGIYYFTTKEPVVEYTTQKAKYGTLLKTVSVTGEIVAPKEINLSSKLSGEVESILVEVGDKVEVGQKIATIDKGTLPEQLSQAQNQVDVQKETLRDMKRKDEVYSYFQKEAQRQLINSYEDAVRQIVSNINDATLYSPINGTVIRKNAEEGEMVSASSATPIVVIAAEGDLQIEVQIPESDIVDVTVGQKAKITLDALSSEEILDAEVLEIDPAATIIQDVVYYKVKLKFSKKDERLKVGMSADVDIEVDKKDNVVMIPRRAVKNENGQDFIEVLSDDEKTTRRVDVKTGFKGDNGMIEVVSDLKGGEKVVVLSSEK